MKNKINYYNLKSLSLDYVNMSENNAMCMSMLHLDAAAVQDYKKRLNIIMTAINSYIHFKKMYKICLILDGFFILVSYRNK